MYFQLSVRNAAKKTGTSTRNKPRRKNRGFRFPKDFQKQENDIVQKGTILFISRCQRLDFHPGLNVSIFVEVLLCSIVETF